MTIIRHIYRHRLNGMVAINDRKTLQSGNLRSMQFNFTGYNATAYLNDGFVVRDGIKLHSGLEITTVLEGDPGAESSLIIESIIVQILGIISFAAVASCGEPKLLSRIIVYDNSSADAEFFSYPLSGDEVIISTPRAVDENIFTQVWHQWDKTPHKERIGRALTWFAKGLGEEQTTDKFISYWVSIEILGSILRRILQQKVKCPGEWDGVKNVFTRLGNSPTFEDVYDARNQLLHGFKEFTPEFFNKIKDYITPTRNAALLCIADALELPHDIGRRLTFLKSLRILRNITVETNGIVTGLPNDISELLANPPELEGKIKSISYNLNEDWTLQFKVNYDHTFHLPPKSAFTPKGSGLLGHAEAGIKDVKLE